MNSVKQRAINTTFRQKRLDADEARTYREESDANMRLRRHRARCRLSHKASERVRLGRVWRFLFLVTGRLPRLGASAGLLSDGK